MPQPLPNSCPTVKSFLLCDHLTVFHRPVLQCFVFGELFSSFQTSILLLGEPDIHNRTNHVTWIHNYDLIIHRSVSPIFCPSKSASLMSLLICSTFHHFFFLDTPNYYQLHYHQLPVTFAYGWKHLLFCCLSAFTAYLWHTMAPQNSFLQQIWRWCAELCSSTCNPISHMVHPFFLLYFSWIASSLLIRSVEWFTVWQAGRVEGVKGRWCRWKEEEGS